MTTRLRTVPTAFLRSASFEVEPVHLDRHEVEEQFAQLKNHLLDHLSDEEESTRSREALKLAANEAAGLAWTTGYPLLVFPALFAEFARKVECRQRKQKRIKGRSEVLLAAV
jgi:hypothetical protein